MDVLSKMLDKASGARQFGYHLKCGSLGLTHLSFADNLKILSDGKVISIGGIVHVLNDFAKIITTKNKQGKVDNVSDGNLRFSPP